MQGSLIVIIVFSCILSLNVTKVASAVSTARTSGITSKLPQHNRKDSQRKYESDQIIISCSKISALKGLLGTNKVPKPMPAPPSNLLTRLPILPGELPKFISLSFMMFWIVFVFTMTRDTKDALIVTNCGAEAIAFLKVYGVVPSAAAFLLAYSKLANNYSAETLFYLTMIPFFVFYALFAFVMYPLRDFLHPTGLVIPSGGLAYIVNLARYWTFSLYYIVSELWGSAGIPLLFWSCANDVMKIDEAKRIYPFISLIGNLGPILSGITMSAVNKAVTQRVADKERAFELSLKILTATMIGAGSLVLGLHHFIRQLQAKELKTAAAAEVKSKAKAPPSVKHSSLKEKVRPSLMQSLGLLARDRYLRNVATMVLAYGLTMEFTEIIWKASVKKAFPVAADYLGFMGRYSTLIGSASFVMMFVGTGVVKTLGWRAGALLTPLMMGLLGLPFFVSMTVSGVNAGRHALLVAVYVGLVQNVLSKATKYAIFDPTKEMTYIPLDQDSKTKGKAAIDVLGARLGKSGAALVQQFLVVIFGNIIRSSPVLGGFFYIAIAAWVYAVNDLAPAFNKLSSKS